MKAKIILTTASGQEMVVATFSKAVEAFQCAALLQGLINSDNYIYYVQHFVKGTGLRRAQPEPLSYTISHSPLLYKSLKCLYK